MKVLFIGLGSIAKRHIANLKSLRLKDIHITVLRSGKGETSSGGLEKVIDRICMEEKELENRYDVIFITNPTYLHYETLLKYQEKSNAFFIEKPVFITGEENLEPFRKSDTIYYVACPLRYMNVIQYLKNHIDFAKVYSVRCISSSYLPSWRAGTDYRKSYNAHKDMGGGVSIDLIHEWDYIQYLIGFPIEVKSIIKKKSNLEIDSDDIAVYIAEYTDKIVEIHLDYFGRKTIRRIELLTEDDLLIADLITQHIQWVVSGREIDLFEDRDSYQKKELDYFLGIISGQSKNENDLEKACKTLRITGGAK